MLNFMMTNNSISLFMGGEHKTITDTHPRFTQIVEAVKDQDEELVKELLDVKRAIEEFGEGQVTFANGIVSYKGTPFDNYLTQKIVELQREGFKITPLLRFTENLMENPSFRAREELYKFLEYGKLPITEDGYFIAYKKVSPDFKDIWSGKMDNSVGAELKMERRDVDDNSSNTCSAGLHFASREYMEGFYGSCRNNKVVALKINPRDVVSIPIDYNNTKGRACAYTVLEELGQSGNFKKLEEEVVYKGEKSKKTPYEKASKYSGVTWDKSAGKFKAQLTKKPENGSRHVGYFETAKKAHKALKKATK